MNVIGIKTTPLESNTWSWKPNKKSKKKRRRNKNKLYNLRLKKHKKKSGFSKVGVNPPPESSNRKIMSDWYWSNYKKAVEWRDKHELAHWKACALALQEENRYLLEIINQMRPSAKPHISVSLENLQPRRRKQGFNFVASSVDDSEDTEDPDEEGEQTSDEVEIEMSEEMIQFFRESIRHKENLKKLKEQELAEKAEEEVKQLQTNRLKRITEMQLLYGEGASMIIGMETAVQLSYKKFCDTKSPKYWPNIPFRL